ncbi:MAG: anaerobic ribonucleoside-triphosphate reductase activating protein [Firmicutes bacterium HGW-Firmicutes-14]|nr:MAG: anaerobic ribonucleoside-triphosphate reductase activating protein [Firmicutes bacterium HGW-Firmicutes-14]
MKVRVAGIVKESVVDGPGLRSVIFAQGCPRFCPGCHNPEAVDPHGGRELEDMEIMDTINKVRLINGVTFSGGEPFMQAEAFARLGKQVKEKGLDLMTYTGYTWEELLALGREKPQVMELLNLSDYLVDGPFIASEKDLNLAFRGSRNQRVIDVRQSLLKQDVILARFA